MKRREFVKLSSSIAISTTVLPSLVSCSSSATAHNYGLGIYTVRDAMFSDPQGTLQRLKEIGYTDVELWSYDKGNFFNTPAAELKIMLDDLEMTASSLHVGIGPLSNELDMVIEAASTLGQKYINCNYLSEEERQSLDQYRGYVDLFNAVGEKTKSAGMQFGYHNHDFEFFDFEGTKPYDLLLDGCDADLVKFEMDMYWMTYANEDPAAYFNRYPGRFPLWHVKDMDADKKFAPVGSGTIDWQKVFALSEQAGLEQFFVEQDQPHSDDIFTDISKSLDYIRDQEFKA